MTLKQTDISNVSDLIFRQHTKIPDTAEQTGLDIRLMADLEVRYILNEPVYIRSH